MAKLGDRYELLCIFLLGIGQMGMMTGYDTQSFILESVIHSAHSRNNDIISVYAGYYGQSVLYLFFSICNFFSPVILHLLGCKWTLFIGSCCFTVYHLGFFYLNNYYFYLSSAVVGLGFSVFYSGHGAYLTNHSTRGSIERNGSLVWAITCFCMVVGGSILAAIFYFGSGSAEAIQIVANATEHASKPHRMFSDSEIRIIYGAMFIVSATSNVILFCLPSRECDNSLSTSADLKFTGFMHLMRKQVETLKNGRVAMLGTLFGFWGVYTSFWTGIYPTTLVFAKDLNGLTYAMPLYAVFIGVGEIFIGCLIGFLTRRIQGFGLKPTMIMGYILCLSAFAFILATTPKNSSLFPTDEKALLIQPKMWTVLVTAFLLGSADGCISTCRNVICSIVIPDSRAQIFSISKFYQALVCAAMFYASAILTIYQTLAIMTVFITVATVCFWRVATLTQRSEKVADEVVTVDEEKSTDYDKL